MSVTHECNRVPARVLPLAAVIFSHGGLSLVFVYVLDIQFVHTQYPYTDVRN